MEWGNLGEKLGRSIKKIPNSIVYSTKETDGQLNETYNYNVDIHLLFNPALLDIRSMSVEHYFGFMSRVKDKSINPLGISHHTTT